jgi:hypothetical protein
MMETTLSHPPLAMLPTHESTARRVGLVMTYNQRETCISAISSLLAQTLALDLIIVSDDCSTDGTYGVITDHFSKNGKPSNVELYRSEKNLGFIPHFNTLLKSYCKDDDLIVYNAGDDISETSRVEEFYREYVTKGKPRYFLGHSYVTSFGSGTEEILVPPIESIKDNRELCLIASAYHIGASQVFTGALFSDFGPILFDDCYEDLTLGYRALLKNAYHFIPRALLRYRVGGLSSWQKNPLEKKRGRLKSTLTQRAVDSMRSGDFEALTIIQDCYSQYGFSIKPHPDRVSITVISDRSEGYGALTYSISDHFKTLHNICRVHELRIDNFIENQSLDTALNAKALLWITTQRLSDISLIKLIAHPRTLRCQNVVLDLGVHSSIGDVQRHIKLSPLISQFLDRFPSGIVHTSCAVTATDLSNRYGTERIRHLHPVQYIDGPDPTPDRHQDKRGLVIELGAHNSSAELMRTLKRALDSSNHKGVMFTVINPDRDRDGIGSLGAYSESINLGSQDDIRQFDFLVIHGAGRNTHDGCAIQWWSLASKWGVPTFFAAPLPQSKHLVHGKTCLFVDQSPVAWAHAIDLICRSYDGLRMIAIEARRIAYFNYSLQKMITYVANVVKVPAQNHTFFNRFLAL